MSRHRSLRRLARAHAATVKVRPSSSGLGDLLRKRRRKDDETGGLPVEPDRPSTLSGGAAAVLEFDD